MNVNHQDANQPYTHPWEHITDELHRLDILIEAGFQSMTTPTWDDPSLDPFRGLVVTESEARSLLTDDGRFVQLTETQQEQLISWEARIAARVEQTLTQGLHLPLIDLQRTFRLSDWDLRCLIITLAPDVNRKYEKLYAYLQDDMTSKFATVDLIVRLSCRSENERRAALQSLSSSSSFTRLFFRKEALTDGTLRSSLTRSLRIDERIASYVQQQEWRYVGPLASMRWFRNDDALPPLLSDLELHQQLFHHMTSLTSAAAPTFYILAGPIGSGKTFQARHACRKLNRTLLEWDVSAAPEEHTAFRDTIDQMLREAKLRGAVPAFDRIHTLKGDSERKDKRAEWLAEGLDEWEGPVFLFGESTWTPSRLSHLATRIEVELSVPDADTRQRFWQQAAGAACQLSDSEAGELAAKFRFTPGRVMSTVAAARKLIDWEKGDGEPIPMDARLLTRAGYLQVKHRLSEKAVKLEPKFNWDDLILPEEPLRLLRQACSRLSYRHIVFGGWGFERKLAYGKGISMLFTGPPGTGKTMSAMVMAKAMNAELYRIDLSRIVSKYIGETEKNLHDIFEEAQLSGAILFFDEADALFGKRSEVKDAQDKYANMETSYLLQKMEEYDGLTILATNFAQNLDDAFTRRISFIVKYPFPDPQQREQLWRSTFPKDMPCNTDIDFTYLAHTFDLAGGPIKNVVLTAAFFAAEEGSIVGMKHMIEAVKQEYKKTGKVLLKDRLGAYAEK